MFEFSAIHTLCPPASYLHFAISVLLRTETAEWWRAASYIHIYIALLLHQRTTNIQLVKMSEERILMKSLGPDVRVYLRISGYKTEDISSLQISANHKKIAAW